MYCASSNTKTKFEGAKENNHFKSCQAKNMEIQDIVVRANDVITIAT